MPLQWRQWLDRALMANVFLVLASFAWLAVALGGRACGIELGFELWLSLWEPLFMPAIGVLMFAALASGLTDWVARRWGRQS